MLRPLWVLLESVRLEEGPSTQFCNGFLKLRVKYIDDELVKKRCQCAHSDIGVMRHNVFKALKKR